MDRTYNNPWIPGRAHAILAATSGSILDVGGGAAPYFRASHIMDLLPFSAQRLQANAWPVSGTPHPWTSAEYTQRDICDGQPWPFKDAHFELGLCSHCLEDLRDPIMALREMLRVCKQILIVCPSRLLEQTRGIEHPRLCGFPHHPWMVTSEGTRLIFRRKTSVVALPGAHLVCPFGKTLGAEDGCMFYYGPTCVPEERVFWSAADDFKDYVDFIAPYRRRPGLFVSDGRRHTMRYLLWRMKQRYCGSL